MDPITLLLGGLAGGLISTAGNFFTTQASNEYNKDLWRQQMAYNTPANQITRMRDAGLNPVLAYGHGAPANIASNPPTMQAARIDNPLSGVAALQQVDNLQAANAYTRAQTRVATEQARLVGTQADAAAHDLEVTKSSIIPITTKTSPIIQGTLGMIDKVFRSLENANPYEGPLMPPKKQTGYIKG